MKKDKKKILKNEEEIIEIEEVHNVFVFRGYEYTKVKILIYFGHIVAYGSITFLLGFLAGK